MREWTAVHMRLVAGGQRQPQAPAEPAGRIASLQAWTGGGRVVDGSGGPVWSASGGYRLPGGSSIGGLGGHITGGGMVWSLPF